MTTTSLIVELLVVGVYASLWLIPVARPLLAENWLVGTHELAAMLYGTALLYMLGVTWNFVADKLFWPIDRLVSESFGGKRELQQRRASLLVRASSPLSEYLLQRRSIVRLFRTSSLSTLILVALIAGSHNGLPETLITHRGSMIGPMLGLLLILLNGYLITLRGYFSFINDAAAEQ